MSLDAAASVSAQCAQPDSRYLLRPGKWTCSRCGKAGMSGCQTAQQQQQMGLSHCHRQGSHSGRLLPDNCNLGAGSIVTTLGAGSSLPCLQLSCIRNHSCAMQAGTPPPPTLWTPSTRVTRWLEAKHVQSQKEFLCSSILSRGSDGQMPARHCENL